jgi:hypothetical protein
MKEAKTFMDEGAAAQSELQKEYQEELDRRVADPAGITESEQLLMKRKLDQNISQIENSTNDKVRDFMAEKLYFVNRMIEAYTNSDALEAIPIKWNQHRRLVIAEAFFVHLWPKTQEFISSLLLAQAEEHIALQVHNKLVQIASTSSYVPLYVPAQKNRQNGQSKEEVFRLKKEEARKRFYDKQEKKKIKRKEKRRRGDDDDDDSDIDDYDDDAKFDSDAFEEDYWEIHADDDDKDKDMEEERERMRRKEGGRIISCVLGRTIMVPACFVVLNAFGEVLDHISLAYIKSKASPNSRPGADRNQMIADRDVYNLKSGDIKKLQQFMHIHRPSLMIIDGTSRENEYFQRDLKEKFLFEWPQLKVQLIDPEIGQLFMHCERAEEEFHNYDPALRQAIGSGRFVLDPVQEVCLMWTKCSKDGKRDIEGLNLHPQQIDISSDLRLKYILRGLINVTNKVGIDMNRLFVNKAVGRKLMNGPLQFIAGLGPVKAEGLFNYLTHNFSMLHNRTDLLARGKDNKSSSSNGEIAVDEQPDITLAAESDADKSDVLHSTLSSGLTPTVYKNSVGFLFIRSLQGIIAGRCDAHAPSAQDSTGATTELNPVIAAMKATVKKQSSKSGRNGKHHGGDDNDDENDDDEDDSDKDNDDDLTSDNESSDKNNAKMNLLDQTRIHPEFYAIANGLILEIADQSNAKDILVDLVQKTGESDKNFNKRVIAHKRKVQSTINKNFLDIHMSKEKCKSLQSAQGDTAELRPVFQLIAKEVISPLSCFAFTHPLISLDLDRKQFFKIVYGDTEDTLRVGTMLSVTTVKISPAGVMCRLDNGCSGFVAFEDVSDRPPNLQATPMEFADRNKVKLDWLNTKFCKDISFKAKVVQIQYDKMTVKLISRTSKLQIPAGQEWLDTVKSTAEFKYSFTSKHPDDDIINPPVVENKQKMIRRMINHPRFQNVSREEAETQLQTKPDGFYIIRPNGLYSVIISWKISHDANYFFHQDVAEYEKTNDKKAIGKKLVIYATDIASETARKEHAQRAGEPKLQ